MLRTRTAVAAALLALLPVGTTSARQGGIGPGQPIRQLPGQFDSGLYDKAIRIQKRMWWHISPEGVLVYIHRLGADPARLSADATLLSDVAIWTGCYAASQACRWAVTKDPDALAQCRVLAHGLAALTEVTGVHGALARNVGRPIPGEPPGEKVEPSPRNDGLWFRGDVSRDQLAGWTLGWAALYRFVEDDEIRALAKRHLGAVASKLYFDDKMWLRDPRGHRTEYGELRTDVKWFPVLKNGPLAAIGLAPILVGAAIAPDSSLPQAESRLRRDGWYAALPEQHTFLSPLVNASNVNMANLALLTIALYGGPDDHSRARRGLDALREATVGWWNAGFCACQLLGGVWKDRDNILGETRRVLHDMTELEVPPGAEGIQDLDRITTVAEKGPQGWTWADNVRRLRTWSPWPDGVPRTTTTRADWLFAYWLARAAGELQPRVGPGADPMASRIEPDLPPWMTPAAPR
jgi:hypothetical protein